MLSNKADCIMSFGITLQIDNGFKELKHYAMTVFLKRSNASHNVAPHSDFGRE